MQLVAPSAAGLPGYVAALERGWSPDGMRGEAASLEELARVRGGEAAFLACQDNRDARGGLITLPDGSLVPRIPGYRRWLWDGEFCGLISFRWQRGTTALPPYCLGHIGYSVVEWKQRRGYATRALGLLLVDAHAVGLPFVEITTDPDNLASRRVIEANGGVLFEQFTKPRQFGSSPGLRFRIALPRVPASAPGVSG